MTIPPPLDVDSHFDVVGFLDRFDVGVDFGGLERGGELVAVVKKLMKY